MKSKILLLSLLAITFTLHVSADSLKTRNIILVTLDGLRWQEVFKGADVNLIGKKKYVANPTKIYERYGNADPTFRRSLLMPFLWSTLVPNGQIYGNRNNNSRVNLTNVEHVSYPGYNELLTGYADPNVSDNEHGLNRNETVFEFIVDKLSDFKGKIAAFASWQTFNDILNEERNGFFVNAGFEILDDNLMLPETKILNEIQYHLPDVFDGIRLDAITFNLAFSYLKVNRPRILYVALDETDDFAHQGKYDLYLNSLNYTDGFIQNLWNWIQADPGYRNQTTLLITCDHGRGPGRKSWRNHGTRTRGSDATWFAVIGPDTPARGEINNVQYYHNQIAATMAALLGLDYSPDKSHGKPILSVLGF